MLGPAKPRRVDESVTVSLEGLVPRNHFSRHVEAKLDLGYALNEPLPDHSNLTRSRQRLGVAIFERYFEKVVDLCQEAGLVWRRELYVDATKVAANADVDSLVPRFYHEAMTHVAGVFCDEVIVASDDGEWQAPADELPSGMVRLPSEGGDGAVVADPPPWQRLEERWLDPHRAAAWGYERKSAWRVSVTDPDATPRKFRGVIYRLRKPAAPP